MRILKNFISVLLLASAAYVTQAHAVSPPRPQFQCVLTVNAYQNDRTYNDYRDLAIGSESQFYDGLTLAQCHSLIGEALVVAKCSEMKSLGYPIVKRVLTTASLRVLQTNGTYKDVGGANNISYNNWCPNQAPKPPGEGPGGPPPGNSLPPKPPTNPTPPEPPGHPDR